MATHKVAEILKARSDLSDEEIARLTEGEAWQWIRASASAPDRADEDHWRDTSGEQTT